MSGSRYEVVALNDVPSRITSDVDVFICSASYEQRSRCVPDAIADLETIGERLVCYNYRSDPMVGVNAEYLIRRLGADTVGVRLDKGNPLLTADNLQRALSGTGDDERGQSYAIDITTFTHEALLILLRLLQERGKQNRVTLFYCPAAEYAVGMPAKEKWLSKGISDIRSVLGFAGDIRPSRKSHLIILAGFEYERAERLIEEYQPHVISLGLGKRGTAAAKEHERINRLAFAELARYVVRFNQFEFSCTDAASVEETVAKQALLFPECNVVVAPMNTKISTVGVAGAAFRNSDIQICYASASQYNIERYSRPGNNCVLTEMLPEFWNSWSTERVLQA